VATEVRYIIFTAEEMRNAVIGFVQKQGQLATPGDVAAVELVGPNEAPSAIVKLQPLLAKKPINLGSQYLVAALLLYCMDRRIPLPKQAEKKIELSVNGLTLVVTTDASSGSPRLAANQVSYGDMANRATRTIGTIQEELARAMARADYAESLISQADERASKAEAARAKSSSALIAVALLPGVRGRLGRWLVKLRLPSSDDPPDAMIAGRRLDRATGETGSANRNLT
jgi:hypothetical protein